MIWKGDGAVSVAHPYREWTWRITIFGVFLGIVATVASVYSGLKIANVLSAGLIAVVLGQVVKAFPGRLRGSMLEVNVGQIITSTVNVVAAGAIFTIPALYIMYTPQELAGLRDFSLVKMAIAATAGALIGVVAIVPLRRRWIEVEVLPFPLGRSAVPPVRALGIPVGSIVALLGGLALAAVIETFKQKGAIVTEAPLGEWLGLPSYTFTAIDLSLLLFAAGLLSGKGGLPFMIGGAVAWWVLAPLVANRILSPETLPTFNPAFKVGGEMSYADGIAAIILKKGLRPIGVGMFIGSAVIGAILAVPALRSILRSMRGVRTTPTELSLKTIGAVVLGGTAVIFFLALTMLSWWRAVLVTTVGMVYLLIANMVVTECEARSAQAPVSGLSFVGAIIAFFITGGNIVVAVTFAVAICTGMCTGSDNMEDLCTSALVGARPRLAQMSQLVTAWIGPIVSVVMVAVLAQAVGFGAESEACKTKAPTCLPAPQATALAGILQGLSQGGFPWDLYGSGALLGALMTLLPVGGAGVLFGIAFYLPFSLTITYALGCLARMGLDRVVSEGWLNRYLVPVAAGLIVGESLVGTWFAVMAAKTIL